MHCEMANAPITLQLYQYTYMNLLLELNNSTL